MQLNNWLMALHNRFPLGYQIKNGCDQNIGSNQPRYQENYSKNISNHDILLVITSSMNALYESCQRQVHGNGRLSEGSYKCIGPYGIFSIGSQYEKIAQETDENIISVNRGTVTW